MNYYTGCEVTVLLPVNHVDAEAIQLHLAAKLRGAQIKFERSDRTTRPHIKRVFLPREHPLANAAHQDKLGGPKIEDGPTMLSAIAESALEEVLK